MTSIIDDYDDIAKRMKELKGAEDLWENPIEEWDKTVEQCVDLLIETIKDTEFSLEELIQYIRYRAIGDIPF